MDASFVVPCKGRLHHLSQTLPNLVLQQTDYTYEIIVVDYSCPDNTYLWCNSHDVPRLRCIRVPAPAGYFNNAHCRNVGAASAKGEYVCFVDADCFVSTNRLQYVLDLGGDGAGNDIIGGDNQDGRGAWAVKKSLWKKVRGYDESLEGWGAEELDFFWRIRKFGTIHEFPRDMSWAIKHDDSYRVKFYAEKDKHRSNMLNFSKLKKRRVINPVGFGNISKYLEV